MGVAVVAVGMLGRFLLAWVSYLAHCLDPAASTPEGARVSPATTVANVGTLVVVNGAAEWLMDVITSTSTQASDVFVSIAVAIIFCRAIMKIYGARVAAAPAA